MPNEYKSPLDLLQDPTELTRVAAPMVRYSK